MAWIDDRIWCHPKFTDLTPEAFSTYIRGIAYSAGMSTRGYLSNEQQKLVGGTTKVRNELINAGLWDKNSVGIVVHDWDEHNGKRDERRAADRERKRLARAKEREMSKGTSAGQSAGRSTGPAHVEGSEGSEGSDNTFLPSYVDVHEEQEGRTPNGSRPRQKTEAEIVAEQELEIPSAFHEIPF